MSSLETKNETKSSVKKIEIEAGKLAGQTVQKIEAEITHWPGLIALLVIGVGLTALSERLKFAPAWVLLPLIGLFAAAAIFAKTRGWHIMTYSLFLVVGIIITLSEIISIALLLTSLPDKSIPAVSLLRDAALLWTVNVVNFALWYWHLDAGGPYKRNFISEDDYRSNSELLFPQLTLQVDRPKLANWRPSFTDYLFVAFNTSTAFSPTDTAVLSTRLKALSMLQAVLSLVMLATLAARAINIL